MSSKFILTEEDLKILRLLYKYFKSYGNDSGTIEIDVETLEYDTERFFKNLTNFNNDWSMEVPDFFAPLLEKLITFIYDNQMSEPEDVHVYGNQIEILINKDTIEINQYFSYEDDGDTRGLTWDLEEEPNDESLAEVFKELEEIENSSNEVLKITFDGSGDSGYIEDNFLDTQTQIPAVIENWCYHELERNFGGWEINEGSYGEFIFDLKNKVIELEYTERVSNNESDTILELKF